MKREKKIIGAIALDKKSPNGKVVQRVFKATSGRYGRSELNLGYYDHENKTLVATDGSRMHYLTGKMVEELFKDIGKSCHVVQDNTVLVCYDKESYGDFVNWKRVVPNGDDVEEIKGIKNMNIEDKTVSLLTKRNFQISAMLLGYVLGAQLNLMFVQDLIGANYKVIRQKKDKTRPVLLVEEWDYYTFTALLMPLQSITEVIV